MNEEDKVIEPRLRFPEFKGKDFWKTEPLGKLAKTLTDKVGEKKVTLMSITSGVGLVSQLEKFGREIAGNSQKNYIHIKNGDFAYNKSSTKLYGEGEVALLEKQDEGAVPNSIFTCFRFGSKVIPQFAKHPFSSNIHGNWLRKFIAVGARANGALQVNNKDLFATPFPYPSPAEQQKIVDCLSSLDDLIQAETERLEALQAHRKGLMQQLFPAEGETVPKLRFPEFQYSGEWVEKELNEVGSLVNGLTYKPNDVRKKGLLVLRSSNIQNGLIDLKDCVYVRTDIKGANLSMPNDILICVRNGSKNLIGKNALIPDGFQLATHGAFMAVFRSKFYDFVFQLFQTDFYKKQVKADLGATINSINGKNFLKYKFPFPENPEEIKKISLTLSSIDKLITSQTDNLEYIKTHKQGLLQQLFPQLKS
jgi:type I restriction enzyme, S subunit